MPGRGAGLHRGRPQHPSESGCGRGFSASASGLVRGRLLGWSSGGVRRCEAVLWCGLSGSGKASLGLAWRMVRRDRVRSRAGGSWRVAEGLKPRWRSRACPASCTYARSRDVSGPPWAPWLSAPWPTGVPGSPWVPGSPCAPQPPCVPLAVPIPCGGCVGGVAFVGWRGMGFDPLFRDHGYRSS